MALHRDIYWVGRQWAVTAVGIQAVDQRRRRAFDIEVARIWDDGLVDQMLTLDWFNREDFDKALAIARARFPEPPRKPLPLVESILELIQPAPAEPRKPPLESAPRLSEPAPAKPPAPAPPAPPIPQLRTEGALARFLPQWRVRR
jgi:hypothetical protein